MYKRPGDKMKKMARIYFWFNSVLAIAIFTIILYVVLVKLSTWIGIPISGNITTLIIIISILSLIASLLSIYVKSLKLYGEGEKINQKIFANMRLNEISKQLGNKPQVNNRTIDNKQASL